MNPSNFTSEVLNSGTNEGQGMDIDMCLKMLSMYLETIDVDLREVVLQNQGRLFNEISDIEQMKSEYKRITTRVESITNQFNSIRSEVDSVCKSVNENSARLTNFNSVVLLLRQITVFRSGIKKIKGFLIEENPTQRACLRAQKTFQEIEKVYIEGHLASKILGFYRL